MAFAVCFVVPLLFAMGLNYLTDDSPAAVKTKTDNSDIISRGGLSGGVDQAKDERFTPAVTVTEDESGDDTQTVTETSKTEVKGWKVVPEPTRKDMSAGLPSAKTGTKSGSPPLAIAPFDATQAKQHEQLWADHLGVPLETTNSIGMKFVVIPPGEFMMGSGIGGDDEKPVHKVTLTQPFYLGVYEVTQDEYERVMGSNPSKFKGRRNPVEQVSWDDAVEFCRKLSSLPEEKSAGRVYRLPTEAEWEHPCRAGTDTKYSFGGDSNQLGASAWFDGNAGSMPHPVGQKLGKPWGLYDMHGNVWEWCSDWSGDYPSRAVTDPRGPRSGSYRVHRGGSWGGLAGDCRSAFRHYYTPGNRNRYLGFRVVLSPSVAGGE